MIAFALSLCQRTPEISHTWVFAVSALDFKNRAFAGLPETDRTDNLLLDAFKSRGVPEQQIVWLKGRRTPTQRIDFEFREMLGKARESDVLFVYYTGHGYVQKGQLLLATYNAEVGFPGWRMERAFAQIKKLFRGKAVVFVVDSCASGRLVSYAQKAGGKVCVLASSESDQQVPEGWAFTTALAEAVRGAPTVDVNADRKVSFDETASFVQSATKAAYGRAGSTFVPKAFGFEWDVREGERTREPK